MEIYVSDFDGFVHSLYTVNVTKEECENRYTNSYGYSFIKHDGLLYVTDYPEPEIEYVGWSVIRSEKQIEEAFSPDRSNFEKWRSEKKAEV